MNIISTFGKAKIEKLSVIEYKNVKTLVFTKNNNFFKVQDWFLKRKIYIL
jgi:hypothetical protein